MSEIRDAKFAAFEIDEVLVSAGQQDLWLAEQLTEKQLYIVPVTYELTGSLDQNRLLDAIAQTVQSSEAFRTAFVESDQGLVQHIYPEIELPVTVVDLSEQDIALNDHDRLQLALAHCQRNLETPFTLNQPGLARFSLVKLGEQSHILHFCLHHLICDNDSVALILNNIATVYAGESLSRDTGDECLEYAEFAAWQNELLNGEYLNDDEDYWLKELVGVDGRLELSIGNPAPSKNEQGGMVRYQLTPSLVTSFNHCAATLGISPALGYFTVYASLLYRLTGQQTIVFGVPTSLRDDPRLEKTIGYFINVLPIKIVFHPQITFANIAAQLSHQLYNGIEHQQFPYNHIVRSVSNAQQITQAPLFNVMYNYFVGQGDWSLSGTQARQHELTPVGGKFPLTLFVINHLDTVEICFEYQYAHVVTDYAEVLSDSYQQICTAMMLNVDQEVSALSLLNEVDYQRQVVAFNQTDVVFQDDFCQHFFRQLNNEPGLTAIEYWQGSHAERFSYEKLHGLSQQIADELRTHIIADTSRQAKVVIFSSASPLALATVVACLTEEIIWIPVDSDLPLNRLCLIVEDACPDAIVIEEKAAGENVSLLEAITHFNIPVVKLKNEWETGSGDNYTNCISSIFRWKRTEEKNDLCYMIYTSGTTGKPKGVEIYRKGLNNYLNWAARTYMPTGANDLDGQGVPVTTSFGFDATITSLLLPLMTRGHVMLFESQERQDEALLRLLELNKPLGLMKTTPSQLEHLALNLNHKQSPLDIKVIVVGGEQMSRAHLDYLKMIAPESVYFNEYGPTEAVVGCCVERLSLADEDIHSHQGVLPIGSPIANTRMYVLNERGCHQPLGVMGELFIGGEGVAKGYWQRPDLTADAFIDDPFSKINGERLYKTGDLACFIKDNKLLCLGRKDKQLKLRGYRIEPEEIESWIKQIPDIDKAVVIVEKQPHERLCGYLVVSSVFTGTDRELIDRVKQHLQGQLPNYMIPTQLRVIEAIPYTINNKIDTAALLTLGLNQVPSVEEPHMEFELNSEVAEQVLSYFSGILNHHVVSLEDNFFVLGGDSLMAARLLAKINAHFSIEIKLKAFYPQASLTNLIALVEQQLH
ncbi:non-ribosomal peptide synthetase [Xenorhabdus koppenhoeferi]|uniref:Amino acid adenylation domain-containing protein n=1 Tax=Xenorhabdus koppenhoeferi TaxID=351659 RepID=A0A1I7F4W9_9GAMM|nr:non-ribosomal peptide synthetase [Xenorhabdus koppenhoeferi]SFU31278.1 amino acid adenylation domain-containing protein [Xenorhabdus koppenhoeferi]